MTDHEQQQPAPPRGKILDALIRAERATFTRPAPKSATAQVKYLLTRMKDSTKDLAERLGVSRRTVQRYRAGQIKTPQKKLQAALVEETESEWQPQVRAQARERAATSAGMHVECTAYFGFTANGSSDDGRERFISTPISPTYAAEMHQLVRATLPADTAAATARIGELLDEHDTEQRVLRDVLHAIQKSDTGEPGVRDAGQEP
nr:helix-turn-helix domain-containing protein [Streptomyces sp. NBC_00830]